MSTQLLIEGYEVELDKSVQFAITKQFEDLSSPTDIINDWSKTVSIPFSRNNNKLFGNIYRTDKTVLISEESSIGMYFNPNKKLDFKLLENGNVVMEGYAKMSSIKKNGGKGTYEVTLYGKLGEIFSELKDLTMEIGEESSEYYIGNVFEDYITKELVKESWTNKPNLESNLDDAQTTDIIGFACTNQGYNEDFTGDSFQSGDESSIEMKNFVVSGKTLEERYKSAGVSWDSLMKNGITPRGFSEWRSYHQIPYIYIPRMFDILKSKCLELTGYDLVLDDTWFNYKNPYYYNLVMMLQRAGKDDTINVNDYKICPNTQSQYLNVYDVKDGIKLNYKQSVTVVNEDVEIYDEDSNKFELSNEYTLRLKIPYNIAIRWFAPFGTIKFNDNVTFRIDAVAKYNINDEEHEDLIKRFTITTKSFYSKEFPNIKEKLYTKGNIPDFIRTYNSQSGKTLYELVCSDELVWNFNKKDYGDSVQISWNVYWDDTDVSPLIVTKTDGSLFYFGDYSQYLTTKTMEVRTYGSSKDVKVKLSSDGRSNSGLSLGGMWNKDVSFFDEILRYTKTFKLVWKVDTTKRELTILPECIYFSDYKVEDWTNKVDFDKNYEITPCILDNKYYKFNYEDSDIYLNKEYNKIYGKNYGELSVKTNYAFNNETKDMFENSQVGITSTEAFLHWKTVRDMKTAADIVYTQNGEIMPCLHDDENSPVDTFGQYFFYKGLTNFGDNENMGISDDTPWQVKNNSYMYIGYDCPDYKTSVTKYPLLDVYYDDYLCLYNKPMKSYCCDSSGEVISYSDKKSIYDSYWKTRFESEVLSLENHILTCYIRLTPIDFINFDFNKFVLINNQLYLVNKICDYSPDNTLTKCELVRVNSISNYIDVTNIDKQLKVSTTMMGCYGGIYGSDNLIATYAYSGFDLYFNVDVTHELVKTITLDNGIQLTIEKLDEPRIMLDGTQYNYVIKYQTVSKYNEESESTKIVKLDNGYNKESITCIRYSDYPYPPTISTSGSFTGTSGTFEIWIATQGEPEKIEFANTSRVSLDITGIERRDKDGWYYVATVDWNLGTSKIGRTDIKVTTMTGYELNTMVTFSNILLD